MATIERVIPDLLNRQETLALGGVPRSYSEEEEKSRTADVLRVLSVDGVYVTPSQAPQAYGDQTPQEIVRKWEKDLQPWIYLYGGWSNGMTLWANIWHSLPVEIPLNEVKVRHIIEGLKSPDRARIYFDYLGTDKDALSGWWDMLRLKVLQVTPEEFEGMTLSHLLLQVGGAPSRWRLMVSLPTGEELLLPPSTSSPFPGAQFGFGFISSYLQFPKRICNSTGARAVDSIALGNLLVRLRHDSQTAINTYLADAEKRRQGILEKRATPPFAMETAEKYALAFVASQEPVVEDVRQILSRYDEEEARGFQYAVIIVSDHFLPLAVYKIPNTRPYAWMQTAEGWQLAV